jgi:KilA-N domain
MKTEQIMKRDENFIQRISDSYFNATTLVESWNNSHPEQKKQLAQYKILKSTIDYIEQLEKEGIKNPLISGRGKGLNAGTWMHPKLFIDLAMWVSVEFKSKVIDYVLDGLIKSRHNAGDYYNQMCATILEVYIDCYKCKPNPLVYIEEANRIKSLVKCIDRNEMTEQELKQLTYLQKVNANLIRKKIGKEARIKKLNEAAEILI